MLDDRVVISIVDERGIFWIFADDIDPWAYIGNPTCHGYHNLGVRLDTSDLMRYLFQLCHRAVVTHLVAPILKIDRYNRGPEVAIQEIAKTIWLAHIFSER